MSRNVSRGTWPYLLGMLLAGLYVRLAIRPAWTLARRLWERRRPDVDRYEWAFRLRDVLGVVVVFGATLVWGSERDLGAWAGDSLNRGMSARLESALVIVVAVVVVGIVFVSLARPGTRLRMLSLAMIPVTTTALTVGGFLVLVWAFSFEGGIAVVAAADAALTEWAAADSANGLPGVLHVLGTIAVGACVFLAASMLPVLFVAAMWMPVRSLMRASDAHPLMASILLLLLAAWSAARSAAEGAEAVDPLLPAPVAWTLAFGGPVLVAALTAWQIVRFRRDHRLRFREPCYPVEESRISRAVFDGLTFVGRALVAARERLPSRA